MHMTPFSALLSLLKALSYCYGLEHAIKLFFKSLAMTGPNLHLNDSIGCFFLGALFATLFYGFTCAQVMYYTWEYPNDMMYLKLLVATLWLLDTATTICDIHFIWEYLVRGHGNLLSLESLPDSGTAEYALAAITVLIVQCYYMQTIWRLITHRWYQIPVIVVMILLALVSCACGFANVYIAAKDPTVPGVFTKTRITATVQPMTASVTDIYITVALSWILHKEKTGFKHTESLIRKLTLYAINRGIFTAVVQTTQAVLYAASDTEDFYWAIFHFPGSKIYVNSVLAIVNARHYIMRNGQANVSTGVSIQDIRFREDGIPMQDVSLAPSRPTYKSPSSEPARSSGRPNPTAKTVITLTTEVVYDGNSYESDQKHA